MPQHDYVVDNQLFPATRTDINNSLIAIATNNSGAVAPNPTYSYQWWVDTSTNPATLRQRNGANNAWIAIGSCDTANLGLAPLVSPSLGGTPTAPTAAATTNTTQVANTAFVQSAQAVIPAWINATLLNSWTNFGASALPGLRYRRYPNADVEIQGVIRKATAAPVGEVIFTLPATMRPADELVYSFVASSGGSAQNLALRFNSNGNVTTAAAPSSTDFVYLYFRFKGEL